MNRTRLETALALLLVPLIFLPLAAHWAANNNRENLANHNYGKNLLNTLEPGSVFMTEGGDNQVFTSAYNQMAEFLRPDVRIYDQKGNVFYRIYGDFRYMSEQEVNIKRDVVDFEIFARGRPVYLTWRRIPAVTVCGDWYLRRTGILFKVTPLKYRLLEDLGSRMEMDFAAAHALIRGYYQPAEVMDKLRRNKQDLDSWYLGSLMQGKLHFISDEEKNRLIKAAVEYRKFVDSALERKVDEAFSRRLIAELAEEGYLSLSGNTISFVKELDNPLETDYWSGYKFEFRDLPNARFWDYLTREILTNYNFYLAEYARERINYLNARLQFYRERLKRLAGAARAEMEKEAAATEAEIARHRKLEEDSYAEAVVYGHDMTPIHHNLGVIFSQRGDLAKAVEAFRQGVQADDYSYGTAYSFILLSMQLAAQSEDPAVETAALDEAAAVCARVYKNIRTTKGMSRDAFEKNPTRNQFRQLEAQLIDARRKLPLATVLQLRRALDAKPDDEQLAVQYITALYQRVDYEGVVNAFQKAAESKWNNEMLVYYFGLSQQLLGQADAALDAFNRLFRTRPLFFFAPFRIAQILEQRRDTAAARNAYQAFLRLPEEQVRKAYPQYEQVYKQMREMATQQLAKLGN